MARPPQEAVDSITGVDEAFAFHKVEVLGPDSIPAGAEMTAAGSLLLVSTFPFSSSSSQPSFSHQVQDPPPPRLPCTLRPTWRPRRRNPTRDLAALARCTSIGRQHPPRGGAVPKPPET